MIKLSDTQRVILSRAAQHEAQLATPPDKLPAAARQSVLRSLIGKGLLEEVPAPREAVGLGWRQDEDGAWIALRITAAGLAAIGVEAEAETAIESDRAAPSDEDHGPNQPAAQEAATSPTAAQEDSLAAFVPAPPSASGEAPERPQRPPVSQHGPIGRATALRTAAATVLSAWDAPDRDGLDEAVAALRASLAATPRAARPPRDPAALRQPRTGTKQESVLALLRRNEGTTIAEIIDATGWQPHTVRGFLAGLKRRGITVDVLERVRQVGPNKQGARGSYSIYRIAAADGLVTAPAEAG
ncbi:DUF3489 domain-containing protein [Neoroseomonas oryzicola]|uniref:DUF3489 domain-containing protein n=1 Tax=Neoroseomonas oryzicola TaxID=535904 RepID=A0A9X9WED8_9PROT|nr:DUF3489 domain-containing protein [Neoroseomonas oryzicola]MBR0658698.1 DUF3489 domain-containing protein [Neoroseomonas oryzicola]NKE17866.1 DUF3489 domain-containing protein [Neoroseomonas oryzicola]